MLDPHLQNNMREIGFIFESLRSSSYFGIFFLSMLVSFVVPLPEVVLLLVIGFLAKVAGFNIVTVIGVSVVGTIIGDNVLYRLSFFGNKYVARFNRKMRAHKLMQYEHLVVDNIGKTIFFLRFITGVRFFGPVISGSLAVPWRKFYWYNGLATILHSIFFVLLGFFAHGRIISLIAEVEIIRNILLFSSVIIVGFLVNFFSKKKIEKN